MMNNKLNGQEKLEAGQSEVINFSMYVNYPRRIAHTTI